VKAVKDICWSFCLCVVTLLHNNR